MLTNPSKYVDPQKYVHFRPRARALGQLRAGEGWVGEDARADAKRAFRSAGAMERADEAGGRHRSAIPVLHITFSTKYTL